MSSETFQIYKHSGKFGVHGPILAVLLKIAKACDNTVAWLIGEVVRGRGEARII
jgi:hypothetical protein